jgi:hypothetical protein
MGLVIFLDFFDALKKCRTIFPESILNLILM